MKSKEKSEHDFILVLTGVTTEFGEKEMDAFFEAGCSDATFSSSCGRVYADFAREAPTMKDAILSAIRDIRKAGIGADVLRVDESNLVSQSEIARKTGRSRQQIHQYIQGTRGPRGFPAPVCHVTDGSPLWYWREVAHWLWENELIEEKDLRAAEQISVVNAALDWTYERRADPKLAEEVRETVKRGDR